MFESRGLAFARRPIFVSCLNPPCTPDITQFFPFLSFLRNQEVVEDIFSPCMGFY